MVAFITFPCTFGVASANIYKWTDEHGRVHFSDTPPTDQKTEEIQEKQYKTEDPVISGTQTGEKQIAIISFTIDETYSHRDNPLAVIQLINRGETVIEPVRCTLQYTVEVSPSLKNNTIVRNRGKRNGNGTVTLNPKRHAHPQQPTEAQIHAEDYHSHSHEYTRTHPDGHRLVHSMLPGQKAACLIGLVSTEFEDVAVTVAWSDSAAPPKFSITQSWNRE